MREEEAQAHIERLHRARLEASEDVLDSLAGAIDRIMKAFPDRGHFLMEFVQNADDAGATVLVARIEEGQVWIMNNGREFSPEDVESLCKVGRSSKKPDDYIGYLGVGFKAVFLISDAPRVYSGPYRFTFDRSGWSDPSRRPWPNHPFVAATASARR